MMDVLVPASRAHLESMLRRMGCSHISLKGVQVKKRGKRLTWPARYRVAKRFVSPVFPSHQVAVTPAGIAVCVCHSSRLMRGDWLVPLPQSIAGMEKSRRRYRLALHVSRDTAQEEWKTLFYLLKKGSHLLKSKINRFAASETDEAVCRLHRSFIKGTGRKIRAFRTAERFTITAPIFNTKRVFARGRWERIRGREGVILRVKPAVVNLLTKGERGGRKIARTISLFGCTSAEIADTPWELANLQNVLEGMARLAGRKSSRERLSRDPIGLLICTQEGEQEWRSLKAFITLAKGRVRINGIPVGRAKLGYCLTKMARCDNQRMFDQEILRAGSASLGIVERADNSPKEITIRNPWPLTLSPFMDTRTARIGPRRPDRRSVSCEGPELTVSSPADLLSINSQVGDDILSFAREEMRRVRHAEGTALRLLEEFAARNSDRVTLNTVLGRPQLTVKGKLAEYLVQSWGDGSVSVLQMGSKKRICIEGLSKDEEKRMPLADRMLARAMALLNDEAVQKRISTIKQPAESWHREEYIRRIDELQRILANSTLTETERHICLVELNMRRNILYENRISSREAQLLDELCMLNHTDAQAAGHTEGRTGDRNGEAQG